MNTSGGPGNGAFSFSNPRVIENHALLEETGVFGHISSLEKEIRDYKDLFASALDIFSRGTIEEITCAAARHISGYFTPSQVVFIWKPFPEREDLVIKAYRGYKLTATALQVGNISLFEPFFRSHPGPVSYGLFSSGEGHSGNMGNLDSIAPELVIPILGLSGIYGMVLMGGKSSGGGYTPSEQEHIRQLMAFVSQAIQNHLNYERSLRDEKTGLYNSSFLLGRLNGEIARVNRTGARASIIMADVDRFKLFNDNYGHIAGDRVLEGLAITIKQGVRGGDVPSRFGGEEFTVLLPDAGREHAWTAAERLRKMVAAMKIPWEPPLPQVTISLGVYSFGKGMELSADEIIHRADEALYMSKERGRNRTTVWGSGLYERIRRIQKGT